MHWDKLTHKQIKERVQNALKKNLDYREKDVLGLPATYLDPEVFYSDAPFLKDAPFMQTLIANPNHIGCHTFADAEPAFVGTHEIERELITICAKEILAGGREDFDGYVSSGGTEANIEAMWIFRNYYKEAKGAKQDEIAVVYSEDTHYSIPKGANLLDIHSIIVPVDPETRLIKQDAFVEAIKEAQEKGIKYFIVIMNMSTTMFGSVDDIEWATVKLDELGVTYMVHADGAYGGFIYPFANESENHYTFKNPKITSVSLDAHKLVQTPYGTGIFLIRKGLMQYAMTKEARYVKGKDYTMVGSRSGANAVAVWMILRTYGSEGWKAKILKLIDRSDRLCQNLEERGVRFFRNPHMNIVTIKAEDIPASLAHQFLLVPDTHEEKPNWYKIVVMEHVTQGKIDKFLYALDGVLQK